MIPARHEEAIKFCLKADFNHLISGIPKRLFKVYCPSIRRIRRSEPEMTYPRAKNVAALMATSLQ